jgi:DNA polymerase I-like protein with 3'-5' exonuclease and polymerase domains
MITATSNGTLHTAREAAARYLSLGLAPIPLPLRAKDPGYPNWQALRVTPDTLDAHFPEHLESNIGVLNGGPSRNTIDVDLDVPEARTVAAHLLPPTGWVFGRDTSRRSHWIYQVDRPFQQAQQAYLDLDGTMLCELRGDGGLTVYPPSRHLGTGELIAWERFTTPATVALDDLQRAMGELAAAAILARHWPDRGNRDRAAMALAGGLARAGWDEERVGRFIGAVALAAGDEEVRMREGKAEPTSRKLEDGEKVTGWPKLVGCLRGDGAAVVRRCREWLGMVSQSEPGARKPGKVKLLPPYQPFPVDALPEPLGKYVSECARALRCDESYVALGVLAAVASAIGNTRLIHLKRGWDEPAVLWTSIVGDSGTLKSPAWRKAVGYLFRKQKEEIDGFTAKVAAYDKELEEYKERKTDAKKKKIAFEGDPPEKPTLKRVIVSDTTIEKLGALLEENPRGLLVARDELSGWLGSFTRYKGKSGGSDLPNWLEMFNAGTVVIDRKTPEKPTLFIQRAAVSIAGGIQPGVLTRALDDNAFDSGLVARLLLTMPPKKEKQWSDEEVSGETERRYHAVIDTLLGLGFDYDKDPCVLRLGPVAKQTWVRFYNEWAREQAAVEGALAAAFSKLEAYAARFTLLHHVVSCANAEIDDLRDVCERSVIAGMTLARWFANEVRRIYMTLAETQEESDARRLVEFIRTRGGRIKVKELMRANDRKYPTAEDATAALQGLVEKQAGRWEDRPAGPKGGRPTRIFILSTQPDETDETDDTPHDGTPEGPLGCPTKPTGAPDDTDGNREKPADFAGGGEVSSVSSVVRQENERTPKGPDMGGEVSSGRFEVSSGTPGHILHVLVTDATDLRTVLAALADNEVVGLDTETTGLDPRSHRIRLLSLAVDTIEGQLVYLVDCAAVDPRPLFEALQQTALVMHNGAFDLGFLRRLGFEPGAVIDTMLLSQLLYGTRHAKGFHGLKACAKRELDANIDKGEQTSAWTAALTPSQLNYAATDAAVLVPLYRAMRAKVEAAGLLEVATIEARCLPAVAWLASSGVAFDTVAWQALATTARADEQRLAAEMDALVPARPGQLGFDGTWNWSSPEQVKEVFAGLGIELTSTDDDALAGLDHPLAALLRDHRAATKKAGTYGSDWLKHVARDGRVYAGWRQLGADSGRMACKAPNLQNLPRGPEYRRCFAAPPGRLLVKADYSQIELRIAAKVSGDEAMLDAYRQGIDLHTLTARNVLGIENVTKQHRQLAKAVNFGLLYGMGAKTFQLYALSNYGLTLTLEQAQQYHKAFFDAYPGLVRWHRKAGSTGKKTIETRTLAGRRRLNVERFTEKLNTPVQGTGADGLKLALALLWERRAEVPGAFPVLAVHDEVVVECDAVQAEAVGAWLRRAMVDAMAPLIDPVPVEVEVKTAPTWGG